MNTAAKFLVMVFLIGVVCAKVYARPLETMSKDLTDEKLILPANLFNITLPNGTILPISVPLLPNGTLPTNMTLPGNMSLPLPGSVAASANKGGELITNGGIKRSEMSKETKPSLSAHETTNGIEDQLAVATATSYAYGSGYSSSDASAPGGSNGNSYASGYGSTSGNVRAEGPNYADAYSGSSAYGQGSTDAEAGPDGATASGTGSGSGSTVAYGSAGR